ncbi:Uncharacterized protein APZ42_000842 [Daphnia magna]|uniref:Uncharacterized protein n=1 Tax=Daphnia magna TaxID=35525 RepID=A0A164JCD9_9CRUS|nr:Uncharacterized protein APZ42_000842 [Daphnia magna]
MWLLAQTQKVDCWMNWVFRSRNFLVKPTCQLSRYLGRTWLGIQQILVLVIPAF